MNPQQTAQPLYSWIRGAKLDLSGVDSLIKFHPDMQQDWMDRHSFAFTPEGRYLQAFKDAEPVSASISDSQP